MRTLLSQFCEEFEEAVRPLLEPLRHCAETLSEASSDLAAKQILPNLLDLRHQLQTLSEKVAGQQAYVLIFGPLKSGKSTLMNAVAAAYVSEVTCLPAYPCMVFVKHAENREFVVMRYNGKQDTFTDPAAMRMQVGRAHTELAGQIRRVEERGEEFDPTVHFTEAVRRIDVNLPAGALEKSSAVLVDTPGLYSRMKFGYDLMTREFRNTAACAIFVVKTDNLFLEQVFEEFGELLELFSRIFLVVNLDSTKKDLRPDGTLAPSLEREDPIRIIEAFENLAMSAPLKAAAEEGRLRIYPVDLMGAASQRLMQRSRGEGSPEPEEEREGARYGEADFDNFIHDLESYLNSTDYLVAFLGDSLRQAGCLSDELRQLFEHTAVQELGREMEDLESRRTRAHMQADVLGRLESHDWQQAFARVGEEMLAATRDRAQTTRTRSLHTLRGLMEGWFTDDSSLSTFLAERVRPLVAECQNDLAVALHQTLSERVGRGSAGLEIPPGIAGDLAAAEVRLGAIGRHSLIQTDATGGERPPAPRVDPQLIPVRKSFWDWILLRSQSTVRRRLFGPSDRPTNRIPRAAKVKRLGQPARQAILAAVEGELEASFPGILQKLADHVFGEYSEIVIRTLSEELHAKRDDLEQRLATIEERLREVTRISNHMAEMEAALTGASRTLEELGHTYGETDPALLNRPVDGEVEPEEAAPEAPAGPSPGATAEPSYEAPAASEELEEEDEDIEVIVITPPAASAPEPEPAPEPKRELTSDS